MKKFATLGLLAMFIFLVSCDSWTTENKIKVFGNVVGKSTHRAPTTHYNLEVEYGGQIIYLHHISYSIWTKYNVGDKIALWLEEQVNEGGERRRVFRLVYDDE